METIFCSRACMHAHIGKACKKSYLALCVSLCKARTRTRDQKHNQLRQKKERCRERNVRATRHTSTMCAKRCSGQDIAPSLCAPSFVQE